jgi:ribosomal protein S13
MILHVVGEGVDMSVDTEKFRSAYQRGDSYMMLCEGFGITERQARKIAWSLGLSRRPSRVRRIAPHDFTEVVNQIGITKARDHFNVAWDTIYRWCSELNIKPPARRATKTRPRKDITIPDDWADVAPTKFKVELASHYGISSRMVDRLIEKTGIRSRKTPHELARERPARERRPRPPCWRPGANYHVFRHAAELPRTTPEQAAHFLRRFYLNVHRADIRMREGSTETWGDVHGAKDHGKGQYHVHPLGIMSELDMVMLAVKRGFEF